MIRTIYVDPSPVLPALLPKDAVIVTPHAATADVLGVVHRSLRSIATEILMQNRIGVASDMTSRHLLKAAIFETGHGSDAGAVAARIAPVLETVLRTGIRTDVLSEKGSANAGRFVDIVDRYRKKLSDSNLVDRQEVLLTAAGLVRDRVKLFVYGYHRARLEEAEFVDAAASGGSWYFLPCAGHPMFASNARWIKHLEDKGWTSTELGAGSSGAGSILARRFSGGSVPKEKTSSEGSVGNDGQMALPFFGEAESNTNVEAKAYAYSDIEHEIRGAMGRAKALAASGTEPSDIAIVCRDPLAYAPVISQISEEYRLDVGMKVRLPLSATVAGNFIRLILDAVSSEFEFESAARLLHHPFGPGIDDAAWHDVRRRRVAGCDELAAAGVDIACLRAPEEPQTFFEWSRWLRNAMATFDLRQKAGKSSREINAYNAFNDAIDEYCRLETTRVHTFDEFAAAVSEILANVQTPFKPGSGGIALHDPDTILGAEFDHVFVIGMAEGVTPPTIVDNPVIDFYERKRLREFGIELRTAADVSRWEEISFYFILAAAKRSLVFSYPRIVDIQEKVPSAFLGRLGLKALEADEHFAVSSIEEQRRTYLRSEEHPFNGDKIFEEARARLAIEQRRESSSPFDEYDGVIGIPVDAASRRWSVSQLTQIGQCPFKWFAGRLLNLKPPEEGEIELDPAKRGSLYHRTLEIAMRKAKDAEDVRAAMLEGLKDAFEEAERDEKVALPKLRNWSIERLDHLEQLRKAIESPAFIGEGSRVLGAEKSYEAEWEGFALRGSIDRVDETTDGLIAIDYKTSSILPKGVKDATGKLSIDVQIPIYSGVALPALYPDKPLGKGIYYSLTKAKVLKEGDAEISQELREFAGRVHEMLRSGSFAVEPDTGRKACKYCEFDLLCRKGPRLDRKMRGDG